jgi:protein-S-isoprenylcysteine O-methyltransferase Ste14
MKRWASLLYGVTSYAIFFATFLYAIGFLGNLLVPKSIDSGTPGPLGIALAINAGLLLAFALQHSVMARPGFKRWWTRVVPQQVERSTYTLASSLALLLLFAAWQPLGGSVWKLEGFAAQAMLAAYFGGVGLVLFSTFLIDHFDLFGLRQVVLYFQGRPYEEPKFRLPSLYKLVRHPLYVGWITVLWAAPRMSAARLVFAIACTAYILVAIRFEERDLETMHGEAYGRYRRQVPMLIPSPWRRASQAA